MNDFLDYTWVLRKALDFVNVGYRVEGDTVYVNPCVAFPEGFKAQIIRGYTD